MTLCKKHNHSTDTFALGEHESFPYHTHYQSSGDLNPDSVMDDAEFLIWLIENHGFKVVKGDFVTKQGGLSKYYLDPVNPIQLMKAAMKALNGQ